MSAQGALDCATALVEQLIASGVQGFVVSPGSRSSALTIAVARSGAPAWVILDERSAGFFAVGRASILGEPVALICTSGTAAANYLPAVVEASQRRVPLIVITADRPPELHGVGANQTIEQGALYSSFIRSHVALAVASVEVVAQWSEAAAAAANTAMSRPMGPVHVNAPFREPFIPTIDMRSRTGQALGITRAAIEVAASRSDVASIAGLIQESERVLVFAGGLDEPIDAQAVSETCGRIGAVLIAEPTSGLRSLGIGTLSLSLPSVAAKLGADLVIQLGRTPTARTSMAYVSAAASLVTVDPDGWRQDPSGVARLVVTASAEQLLCSLPSGKSSAWSSAWCRLDQTVDHTIDAAMRPEAELWEGSIAHAVAAVTSPQSVIVAGSSMPIRDLDAYGTQLKARVVANRGASGIDGLVSTMAGVASSGTPTVGMLGDLSVLHDASGLMWLAREHAGTLVVVDNDGGAIFDHVASSSLPEHERWFRTPHEGRLAPLLEASGAEVVEVATYAELIEVLGDISVAPPMRIVHARVNRDHGRRSREAIHSACETAAVEVLEL